jgi:hypothetical protein
MNEDTQMENIRPNRAGLVVALLLGCLHFA